LNAFYNNKLTDLYRELLIAVRLVLLYPRLDVP
jgi:hypothetical protein